MMIISHNIVTSSTKVFPVFETQTITWDTSNYNPKIGKELWTVTTAQSKRLKYLLLQVFGFTSLYINKIELI